ncbi:MAG: SLC13 family permease [Bdellovibrionia bacterium]
MQVLVLALIVCWSLISLLPYSPSVNAGLAITAVIAILWITEAIHVTLTALFIPVLAVFTKIQTVPEAFTPFADPIIFLFLGGFALASALQTQEIDRWLADKILTLAKGDIKHSLLYLFILTACLSMWVSNMATTAMMLPLAMGLVRNKNADAGTKAFIVIGVAHSATIGGLFTMIGSPPNAIAGAAINFTFIEWITKVAPFALIFFPIVLIILKKHFKPHLDYFTTKEHISYEWTIPRVLTVIIFLTTVTAWIFSQQLAITFGITKGIDSIIAILSLLLLGFTQCITWKSLQSQTDWGVLLLFGGGIALSEVLSTSGANNKLIELLIAYVQGLSPFIFILLTVTFIVFLTELTSNTASAALLIPIFKLLAESLGMQADSIVLLIAIAASCGFMLPVATPPNAIAYASGWITQKQMMSVGLKINLTAIALVAIYFFIF